MKIIRYFDGHIVINLFGLIIRIKKRGKYNCPDVISCGINTEQNRDKKVIVSLTTFPKRINMAVNTIKTLLSQTMKPDMVILWLAQGQFPNKEKDLPNELLDLCKYGLTIDWYRDIRSYKKIIPALKKYPDSIIITTDDDIYYSPDTVETLYKSYLEHPNDIHSNRCDWLTLQTCVSNYDRNGNKNIFNKLKRIFTKNKKEIEKENKNKKEFYITWAQTKELYKDKHKNESSFRQRLTGYGAVLYPPHTLYKDATNEELIAKIIPTHDDIWLWAMAVLNGTKTRLVKGYSESINYIENSQQFGLCKINKKGIGIGLSKAYDIILREYPQIIDIMLQEQNRKV